MLLKRETYLSLPLVVYTSLLGGFVAEVCAAPPAPARPPGAPAPRRPGAGAYAATKSSNHAVRYPSARHATGKNASSISTSPGRRYRL